MTTRVLPSDLERMSESRSRWADDAIHNFMAATGSDMGDALADLLADLMHWADRYGFVFDIELVRAEGYYMEEAAGWL